MYLSMRVRVVLYTLDNPCKLSSPKKMHRITVGVTIGANTFKPDLGQQLWLHNAVLIFVKDDLITPCHGMLPSPIFFRGIVHLLRPAALEPIGGRLGVV